MDCIFCTLFDSNYLDKGLTLYYSMVKYIKDFRLYVFAFDDICYDILKAENLPGLIPISLNEFETDDLLKVKKERTKAEYCWTCSPWIIKHVLDNYNEKICTYIDADMEFFSSPKCIFDEMKAQNCSVIIVPHRFRDKNDEIKAHNTVGSYCVEFNTFVKDENGKKALSWWAEKCLEWCFYVVPGTTEWYGDQKYLNVFPEKFDGVMISNHYGLGLAPWNIDLVEYYNTENEIVHIQVKMSKKVFPVVLFHFENVSFITKHILHSSSRAKSLELYKKIYDPYIKRLLNNRQYIETKYDIRLSRNKRIVTSNFIMGLYQRFISPFKRVKHFRDLYWVK